MKSPLWQFADETVFEKTPLDILKGVARQLNIDTNEMFCADVVQLVTEDNLVAVSFYVVVPSLRNYMYKLIEVLQPGFVKIYPVSITLFGIGEGNIFRENASNATECEQQIEAFIRDSNTKQILSSLRRQILKNDFQ